MDEVIDKLIATKGAKPIYVGFDWSKTDKLIPTGEHLQDKLLAAKLTPAE